MYTGLHVKYPLFLSGFNKTWICLPGFRKKIFKIWVVGAEFFHGYRQTDRLPDMKLIVFFSPKFCKTRPKLEVNTKMLHTKIKKRAMLHTHLMYVDTNSTRSVYIASSRTNIKVENSAKKAGPVPLIRNKHYTYRIWWFRLEPPQIWMSLNIINK